MSLWRKRSWLLAALLLGASVVAYNSRQGVPLGGNCWSPNGEYFLVRRQTLTSAVISEPDFETGWILIFDKYGNLIHRWDGSLHPAGGPFWDDDAVIVGGVDGAVLPLPTAAGNGDLARRCY
ncbi:hypothetical protein [Cupriavidus sp. U2]|uniref:hypothetical protein n=1 Tax=Cupriavidus sp. U2 TaxID=2920269 RepID=UPI00129EABAE|nr:hypothetical protein [Cupriavidus sp. U2]